MNIGLKLIKINTNLRKVILEKFVSLKLPDGTASLGVYAV
jgi:hypothetical protein